ncbi:MAG: tetratricopeptide repeat protein [Hyphomicrobiales bacterium]
MANPSDLDAAFAYASLSAQEGDLEGAISTLERMLIFAPGLPRLQLELGVLYFRLGAYDTSDSYFQAVLANPATPADVLERVKVFEKAIERQRTQSPVSFWSLSGIRWQSNANNATATADIVLNGLPFQLDSQYTAQPDWSFVSSNVLSYSHELQNQGDTFDIGIATYSSVYFTLTNLNTQVAEMVAGPSFNMGRFDVSNTYTGVYAIAGGSVLGQQVYYSTLGAGASVRSVLDERTRVIGRLEYRHRWYNDTQDLPYNDLYTGDEIRAVGYVNYLVTSDLTVTGGLRVARQNANAGFYSDWEFGLEGNATKTFPSLLPQLNEGDWALSGNVLYVHRSFDDPDPTINASDSEYDNYLSLIGSLSIPISEHFAAVPQVQYQWQGSNYPLQQFDTWTLMLALSARF